MTTDNPFVKMIVCADPEVRDQPFLEVCLSMPAARLWTSLEELEQFRHAAGSLYHRVRASLFLYAAYRFLLMESPSMAATGTIPYRGFTDILERRFEEAIQSFRRVLQQKGPDAALLSALAESYHRLAFQDLLDQVRRSVRSSRGNQWMFRVGDESEHPVRLRPELLRREAGSRFFPILKETTPVRLDLSHSGWSDIFFLGMDYPEGARVLNISVDLGVYGRDAGVQPPIETFVRVIPESCLRLTSLDLHQTKDITELRDLFNFGNDYLGLLKAGVIASGVIPPSFEGSHSRLPQILSRVCGADRGLELITRVNDIPKGSRLAVSTNLLASIISLLMRATGQTMALEGIHREEERRLVASRAILGEWIGGSGGGWQDSGGVWPGFKVIYGVPASEGDPEFGISRGCLLPRHRLLGPEDLHPEMKERLADSLVLVHGGIAQNVGPILEMVTEKYLLRGRKEWEARQAMRGIFDRILDSLKAGDVRRLAAETTLHFTNPLATVIPWVTNLFTETIMRRARQKLGQDYWGFLMLGGMSGGGMAMFVHPGKRDSFRDAILEIMHQAKKELEDALPFAMEPVVYNFQVNENGTAARMLHGEDTFLPASYYSLHVPGLLRRSAEPALTLRLAEVDRFARGLSRPEDAYRLLGSVLGGLLSGSAVTESAVRRRWEEEVVRIRQENGFDPIQHERFREDLHAGKIGLAHNRLPIDTLIEDVAEEDLMHLTGKPSLVERGEEALRQGSVASFTLAGGVGTRWTTGAGVIKALNPFVRLGGIHRSFMEIHLGKSTWTERRYACPVPHLISTSFLTHQPIARYLDRTGQCGYAGPLYLSPGRSISQRLVPMVRDLMFLWEEMPQETLDEQKQKVREAVRKALMDWARSKGESSDYTDNLPVQRFNPPGHWYEVANLLRNGVLARLLEERPQLETLLLHNIDTLGANLDPEILGAHLASGNVLTFEVVPRRIEDRGGGLARVNGHLRLLEGLAQPREEDELDLRYYNTMTTWIQIDPLLQLFGLTRKDLNGPEDRIASAVRKLAHRMPTYVTIKDVKWRWGHGQEDVYPVAQFEKLWSDMSALPEIRCGFLAVPRMRGRQLKDPGQLDAWANDGGREHVAALSGFAV